EQGLAGSIAYAKRHADELARCVATLHADLGTGKPTGWAVPGRPDVAEKLRPFTRSLKTLGADGLFSDFDDFAFFGDHGPYVLAGVPSLYLANDTTHYFEVHHLQGDTLEKVDTRELAISSAIIATTAWSLANDAAPGPRLDRAAVDAAIDKAG